MKKNNKEINENILTETLENGSKVGWAQIDERYHLAIMTYSPEGEEPKLIVSLGTKDAQLEEGHYPLDVDLEKLGGEMILRAEARDERAKR